MKNNIKNVIKKFYIVLSGTPVVKLFSALYQLIDHVEYIWFDSQWKKQGYILPTEQEIEVFRDNVTFIFKSFERQKLATRLIQSIQKYYPGCQIIIADDSRYPLSEYVKKHKVNMETLTIIQLPFNSGLSYGLQCALDQVTTPYVIRMDDDQVLTRRTQFGKQLKFLMDHTEIDLSGVMQFTTPCPREPKEESRKFFTARLGYPYKEPILPNMTQIDEDHVVVLKASNVFVAKTEKLNEVGYDSHIRMIDHNDFFCRACGTLVSVIDTTALVHHSHNRFNQYYAKFRNDIEGDYDYISKVIEERYPNR